MFVVSFERDKICTSNKTHYDFFLRCGFTKDNLVLTGKPDTDAWFVDENITKRTKLGGLVKNGSIEISEANQLDCIFILKEGENELAVNYNKTRPDLFKDGAEVIVTGEYLNGVFYADELQTKCASRYEGDLRNESNYNLEEIDT